MKARFWGAVLALLFALPTYAASACSWDSPGANPFRGDVPAAVDRYTDIPKEVRKLLKERMQTRDYDETAEITRDSIRGKDVSYQNLRQMHFGDGKVCNTVSRAKWKDGQKERGLIYCEMGYCIIVPTVCRNVSRVDRIPPPMAPSRSEFVGPLAPIADAVIPPGGNFINPNTVAPVAPVYVVAKNTFANPAPILPWYPVGGTTWFPSVGHPVPVPYPVFPGTPQNPGTPDSPGLPPNLPPGNPPLQPPGTPPIDAPWTPPDFPIAPPVPEPQSYLLMLLGIFIVLTAKSWKSIKRS